MTEDDGEEDLPPRPGWRRTALGLVGMAIFVIAASRLIDHQFRWHDTIGLIAVLTCVSTYLNRPYPRSRRRSRE
jgi:hypothetical protein